MPANTNGQHKTKTTKMNVGVYSPGDKSQNGELEQKLLAGPTSQRAI